MTAIIANRSYTTGDLVEADETCVLADLVHRVIEGEVSQSQVDATHHDTAFNVLVFSKNRFVACSSIENTSNQKNGGGASAGSAST